MLKAEKLGIETVSLNQWFFPFADPKDFRLDAGPLNTLKVLPEEIIVRPWLGYFIVKMDLDPQAKELITTTKARLPFADMLSRLPYGDELFYKTRFSLEALRYLQSLQMSVLLDFVDHRFQQTSYPDPGLLKKGKIAYRRADERGKEPGGYVPYDPRMTRIGLKFDYDSGVV